MDYIVRAKKLLEKKKYLECVQLLQDNITQLPEKVTGARLEGMKNVLLSKGKGGGWLTKRKTVKNIASQLEKIVIPIYEQEYESVQSDEDFGVVESVKNERVRITRIALWVTVPSLLALVVAQYFVNAEDLGMVTRTNLVWSLSLGLIASLYAIIMIIIQDYLTWDSVPSTIKKADADKQQQDENEAGFVVDTIFRRSLTRLENSVQLLLRKSVVNLGIGIILLFVSFIVIVYTRVYDKPDATAWSTFLMEYIPTLTVLAFIQLIMFYFFRLSRLNLNQVQTYEEEIIDINYKRTAMKTALLTQRPEIIDMMIAKLMDVDHHKVLTESQTTSRLRLMKHENEYHKDIFKQLLAIINVTDRKKSD